MKELNSVLAWLHSSECELSKNGRLVSVAIAWYNSIGAAATLDRLSTKTGLGRTAAMTAITEACGHLGIFSKRKGGPGQANRYAIRKTDGQQGVKAAMTAGNPTLQTDGKQGVKTAGVPYTKQISTSGLQIPDLEGLSQRVADAQRLPVFPGARHA